MGEPFRTSLRSSGEGERAGPREGAMDGFMVEREGTSTCVDVSGQGKDSWVGKAVILESKKRRATCLRDVLRSAFSDFFAGWLLRA